MPLSILTCETDGGRGSSTRRCSCFSVGTFPVLPRGHLNVPPVASFLVWATELPAAANRPSPGGERPAPAVLRSATAEPPVSEGGQETSDQTQHVVGRLPHGALHQERPVLLPRTRLVAQAAMSKRTTNHHASSWNTQKFHRTVTRHKMSTKQRQTFETWTAEKNVWKNTTCSEFRQFYAHVLSCCEPTIQATVKLLLDISSTFFVFGHTDHA